MSYLKPAEISERNEFTERTIEQAHAVLQDANVSVGQNSRSVQLARLAAGLYIPNYSNAEIDISEHQDESGDKHPIVALAPGETLELGPSFKKQTGLQREMTIEKFKKWEPTERPADQWVDRFLSQVSASDSQGLGVTMREHSSAMVNSLAPITDLDFVRDRDQFDKLPTARLAKVLLKPLIVIRFDSTQRRHTEQQVVAHELAHVVQKTHNPVRIYGSQRSANMQALRDELVAYHAGATTKRALDAANGTETPMGKDVQLGVDKVRELVNKDTPDMFQPTPNLLKTLEQLGNILHDKFPYDHIVQSMDAQIEANK